jgi:tRNA threonylcarbamoyladenosine modification (KEOPS) complex  Pcc1 subunit
MIKKATFIFFFPSAKDACIVSQSLSPEIQHKIPKSNVTFFINKKTLEVNIESDDVSSLRAACNSYLRWIQTALSVKQLV